MKINYKWNINKRYEWQLIVKKTKSNLINMNAVRMINMCDRCSHESWMKNNQLLEQYRDINRNNDFSSLRLWLLIYRIACGAKWRWIDKCVQFFLIDWLIDDIWHWFLWQQMWFFWICTWIMVISLFTHKHTTKLYRYWIHRQNDEANI